MARGARASSRLDRATLAVCAALSIIALVLPAQVREPVAAAMRSSVLAPLLLLQERAELSRRAFLAHDAAVAMRDSVALRALTAISLEAENARLRSLLGLGSRLRWGFVPAEALHGRGVRDEFGVTLTAGSAAGVRRLSPVVAPEGLVGVVDNVDRTLSHALLWTSPDFRASGMTLDGSAAGIIQAHADAGPGRYLLEMRGVPFRTSVKRGTLVVTSGLGGVFPRGIPVGWVVGETKTAESWARTYLIRPAVFPSDVYSVMILQPERVSQGVDNVWAVGGATDSTVRKIMAAGDSLARTAALEEARARQAAQDSTLRDSLGRLPARAPDTAVARPRQAPVPVTPSESARADSLRATRRDSVRLAPARRDSTGLPITP